MLPLILAGAGIASLAGGIAGAIERSNASDEAKALMKQRLAELESVGAPPDTSLPIILEEFKSQGVITPELEKEISLEASKVAQIQEDPSYKNAQKQALQFLQQRSDTGLGAEETAAFNALRKEAAKEAEGRRQQILQNMAARGMSGSGAELAAQLSSSQAADEQLSAGGDRLAAEAAKNALSAMMQSGQLAGQLRGQDFDVASTKARAEDELKRFNVSNQISRQTRNLGQLNEAQIANLREKQRIADANIAMVNAEKQRQMQEKANVWKNKLNLAGLKGGVYGEQADQRLKEGAQNAQGWQQMGQGVSQAISSLGSNVGKSPLTSDDSGFNAENIYDDNSKNPLYTGWGK